MIFYRHYCILFKIFKENKKIFIPKGLIYTATVKPFKAVRPLPEYAGRVAALPYDVMNRDEAAKMAEGNPYSFLHIDKAEIDFPPETDPYSEQIYEKAASALAALETGGVCRQDEKPGYYIYRQIMNGRSQTGIVGCVSIDDYINNVVKKHELTHADKEADRIHHVDTCDANTGPIFLTYRRKEEIAAFIEKYKAEHSPVCDFMTDQRVRNTVWVVDDEEAIENLTKWFGDVESMYIADGHHRAASAINVGKMRRQQNPGYTGDEEFNFFLAILFSSDELAIMDYNRVINTLNGNTPEEFIEKMSEKFTVEPASVSPYRPEKPHTFGMFLEGKWFKVTAKEGTYNTTDPVESLDVSILQENLIDPLLGIKDLRNDKRIDFVGGIRGLKELERRATTDMCLAFAMFPVTLDELMAVSDAGRLMPPKSTWFEPKLLSGLFIHKLK